MRPASRRGLRHPADALMLAVPPGNRHDTRAARGRTTTKDCPMTIMAIALTVLLAINLAVAYLWIVRRIDQRGYGRASREKRRASMMPVVDRTVVVERHDGAPETVRTIEPTPGATAGA